MFYVDVDVGLSGAVCTAAHVCSAYVCMYLCVRLFDFMQYLFAAHTQNTNTALFILLQTHQRAPPTTTTTWTRTWVTHVRGAHLISMAEVD